MPICSWGTSFTAKAASKRIWSINCSIHPKNVWPAPLLLLANFGKDGKREPVIAKISQETFAEMIGTTRSRATFFMNKFRRLGFIDYNGDTHSDLRDNTSLLNMVLHEGISDAPSVNIPEE